MSDLFSGQSIADPGGNWNPSDVIVDRSVPRRRLIWAGSAGGRWFIRYEHGGIGEHEHILVYDVSGSGILWRGGGSAAARGSPIRDFSICPERTTCEW
jgi:hypothetical protein